ncbi:NAD-dependent deacetylase [Paraburkholderia sp. Ac-20336]|uniref:SIR2 family NAD-dependent protein deacylase n=1 Tax=Paraburkholderia sp. Ac-20336 TaxID=2703886 RepID=UPI0019812522|nr:Sir2 family NAD-dependent protein deacetylase [Paraburkholderia sp. Ac-20336]MBN3804966.1 NAD-dependent deacetylase [Paraburkholderia sp. Ac-20336]
MDTTKEIEAAAQLIRNATGILITAGPGMGVDSRLPDFHGEDGFWRAYPALKTDCISFQDIANGEAFRRDPGRAWGFYGHWLSVYRRTVPHEGFDILHRWASTKEHSAFVFTSNVDGQFQKAGFQEKRILECRGSLHRLQCVRPCSPDTWSTDNLHPVVDEEHCRLVSALPRCPNCGSVARPNILLFDDSDWNDYHTRIRRMRSEAWLSSVERMVVVELGAGLSIPTVQAMSERTRAHVVRIALERHAIDGKNGIELHGRPLDVLRTIARNLTS